MFESRIERDIERIRGSRKVKDSRLFEVVEEVFDYPTLMALYYLINRGYIDKIYGAVASGKEARIYWGEDRQGRDLAIKIFLVLTAGFRRGRLKYIEGDPRFRRVGRNIRDLVRMWCSKEYRNLVRAYEAGVRVPKPYVYRENILVMEFIGKDERGKPAPLLKEAPPEDPDKAYEEIKRYIRLLYERAQLVHADLSEYNILNRGGELIIIDWGSAVHKSHPHASEFLLRDIKNIFSYFRRLGVEVESALSFYEELVGLP